MDGYIDKQALQDIADAIREKNGSSDTYKPSEMAEAIERIKSIDGFNWEKYGLSKDFQDSFNNYYKENAEYTLDWFDENKDRGSWARAGQNNVKLLFLPNIEIKGKNFTQAFQNTPLINIDYLNNYLKGYCMYMFTGCGPVHRLPPYIDLTDCTEAGALLSDIKALNQVEKKITIQAGNVSDVNRLISLQEFMRGTRIAIEEIEILGDSVRSITWLAHGNITVKRIIARNTPNLNSCNNVASSSIEYVKLGSIKNCNGISGLSSAFLETIEFDEWVKGDISLNTASLLSANNIRYIIWHALNGENALGFENEGATSRTLKLHATPYASWEEWKTTKPSVDDCEYLGVDETEITKYGELTWEDIALNVKLITIAK